MNAGSLLAGKYRLIERIGQGGMGSVWLAERHGWQARVAIKLIDGALLGRADIVQRFAREAKIAANLRSPHVVQILDDGVDEATGAPFMVMELLEGEPLAARLERVARLSPEVTAQIIGQVCRALARAHELGMIHRDLKPDNIFLVRNHDEELAKVLDFGIGQWKQGARTAEAATRTGMIMGTLHYMSPEQISGARDISHATDLWSLGVIACECLTGQRPFEAADIVGFAVQICTAAPPVPSELGPVPDGFDAWFARATARSPAQRFASALELSEALRKVCGSAPLHLPVATRAAQPEERLQARAAPSMGPVSSTIATALASARRWSTPSWLLAAGALLLAGASASYLLAGSAQPERDVASATERSPAPSSELSAPAPSAAGTASTQPQPPPAPAGAAAGEHPPLVPPEARGQQATLETSRSRQRHAAAKGAAAHARTEAKSEAPAAHPGSAAPAARGWNSAFEEAHTPSAGAAGEPAPRNWNSAFE